MLSKTTRPPFERSAVQVLVGRIATERMFIQVVAGPRQVGKTTLVHQALDAGEKPFVYVSADEPELRDGAWLATQWERARVLAAEQGGAVLALDEVQKVAGWSEAIKRLWDEDSLAGLPLWVVVLGSAPLLVQAGLTESLAGRFEVLGVTHWSLPEMRDAFGFGLDDYVFFGGYPGAARLVDDWQRWRRYVLDALIETTISRDVLLLSRVRKPALLRRVFELGCRYSGQILSYNKMLGQLQDAGNSTTLAHYLDLLAGAGMVAGLQKFAGEEVRRRGSSPKLQALNTGLITALAGISPKEAQADRSFWGHLVESAVGAHLFNGAAAGGYELSYWRHNNREVDFVLRRAGIIVAIEVKSGRSPLHQPGLEAFSAAFGPKRVLLVGAGGIPLEEFLTTRPERWLEPS